LTSERALTLQGAPFTILGAEWADEFITMSMKPGAARKKVPLDEGLEGGRIRWGHELEFGGIIKFVDVDNDRVVVQPLEGAAPKEGETAWVFLNDFLGPLIDMWQGPMAARAAKALQQSKVDLDPIQEVRPLPPDFADLRKRQVEAVQNTAYRCSIVIGPPGTGKSFTIGATAAYLLRRFSKARILVVGPTNVAVDTAILAIDDWLQRIGRRDLAAQVKRIGAHFDPRKYVDRPHLLAPGIAEKVNEYLVLEASEPPKTKIVDYVKWKDRLDAARTNLGADIETTAASARVVGVTVATAVRWHHCLQNPRFPFVLCDEASQVLGPAAMMMAALGAQTIFAGDPQQLSPIARSDSAAVRGALTRTAFDVFAHVRTVRLNEQSRMAQAICHIVGATFYGGDLLVCQKANRDEGWRASRSPFFVNGREVPRVCFDPVREEATFSTKYGGFIRFESAKLVLAALDELAGSYVDPKDIVVLTPYRAQVALLRSMLRRDHAKVSVGTVHRAQGSERTLVIFDPVDASSTFFNGAEGDRLINVAISRAKAHVVIPYHANDLKKPAMRQMHGIAAKLWQTAGDYAAPFTFR
tara:strand:+ start:1228 stop:2976 length:1749 start_codon:yes stop_codon:yes gene_type:complete